MKQQPEMGSGIDKAKGIHGLLAMAAQKMESLDEAIQRKNELPDSSGVSEISGKTFDDIIKMAKSLGDRYEKENPDLAPQSPKERSKNTRRIVGALLQARLDVKEAIKILREGKHKVSKSLEGKLNGFVSELRKFNYDGAFEAKPMRPVPLSEVQAVVMPIFPDMESKEELTSSLPDELRSKPVYFYELDAENPESPLDDVNYNKAINQAANEHDLKFALTEKGDYYPAPDEWGTAYTSMEGKGIEAINFLLEKKGGFVPNAFYRKDIAEDGKAGGIDLVWGRTAPNLDDNGGYGLAHILKKHPEIDWNRFSNVIQNGKLTKVSHNRIAIYENSINNGRIVIALNFLGRKRKWVVTAYGDDLSHTSNKVSPTGSTGSGLLSIRSKGITSLAEIPEFSILSEKLSGTNGTNQYALAPVSDNALIEGPSAVLEIMQNATTLGPASHAPRPMRRGWGDDEAAEHTMGFTRRAGGDDEAAGKTRFLT